MNEFNRIGFDNIIGQDYAKKILKNAVISQNPAHAYMFVGLEGTGKLTTALEFAKALNCESPINGNACGNCTICKTIEHGNYPDTKVWSPKGQNTIIDHMREMRNLSNFRPVRGKWRINIIEKGDTLNDESANAILKLLEESPDYLVNMLLFKNSAGALPTINSRCQLIRFVQVPLDILSTHLQSDFSLMKESADFMSAFSLGCPGKAIRLIDDKDFHSKRDVIIKIVEEIAKGNTWVSLKLAEDLRSNFSSDSKLKKSDDEEDIEEDDSEMNSTDSAELSKKIRKGVRDILTEALDMLILWYRDLLAVKLQHNDANLVNTDKMDDIMHQCKLYKNTNVILESIDIILKTKRNILSNANAQISTESLMIQLTTLAG